MILSTLLLVATAITNRNRHAVKWKSSVLQLLIGRLETYPEHDLGPLRSVDEVQRMSKKVKVLMKEDRGSIGFVEQ